MDIIKILSMFGLFFLNIVLPLFIIAGIQSIGKQPKKKYVRRVDGTFKRKVPIHNMDGSTEYMYL